MLEKKFAPHVAMEKRPSGEDTSGKTSQPTRGEG